ncbi:MAG: type I-F CRISPR-associated protein Csy1 [Saccharospirillum sp.]
MKSVSPTRMRQLKELIHQFINSQCDKKIEEANGNEERISSIKEKFKYKNWLEDLASRAEKSQGGKAPIKLATHVIKAIHPEAKGSCWRMELSSSVDSKSTVGTHSASLPLTIDIVGNAANRLNEFKLLDQQFEGVPLLHLIQNRDPDLLAAISEDTEVSERWVDRILAVASLTCSTHPLAKQLYWLVDDDPANNEHYHLLAPLYPTSLVHQIYKRIQIDLTGEAAKAARKAKREKKFSEVGYCNYSNLAVQKLGGTKPQNISQLNSERGGNNYLLASLPPQWRSNPINPPLHTESVFPRFGRKPEVQWLIRNLLKFLKSSPSPNMQTRDKVDGFVNSLIEELVIFSGRFDLLDPGWSKHKHCRLAETEKLWLDPWRSDTDEGFREKRKQMEWPHDIEDRFAKWLNHQLLDLPMGDVEYKEWLKHIQSRLNLFREVLV